MADYSTNVSVRRPRNSQYEEQPNVRIGRSTFNRSHGLKTTFDASYLIPIMVDDVMPGDTFTCRLNGFVRIFSPLKSPVMDNIELETFFFFVPTRLVWDNWEYFQGAHDAAGAQDTTYTVPVCSGPACDHDAAYTNTAALMAYFGIPDGLDTTAVNINALPFRCYQFIYNEWFRDQNLIDEVSFPTDNGPDTGGEMGTLRKSAKKHDYFTSALPYLQKGTAPTISIGTTAPIIGLGMAAQTDSTGPVTAYETGGSDSYSDYFNVDSHTMYVESDGHATTPLPTIYADLSSATGVTINDLRQQVMIQRLLERDARGGTRYVESIKAHFGVTSPDFRLQRPEYLGGGRSYVNVSPVANTSEDASNKQGHLTGTASGTVTGHGWAKSFTEHGYIIGLVRARGDITYHQGLDRLWSRSSRYDFYIPALAHLGEQSVLNKEIYVSNSSATDDAVFGYQERWAEYRTKMSRLTGYFNPDTTGALSFWHLAEDFSALPSLNQTFIEDATPMSRVVAVTDAHDFVADIWFDYKCARPMPVRSIPSLTGRF